MLARKQSTPSDGKPARESPRQAGEANSCIVIFLIRRKIAADSGASSAESRCESGQIRGTPLPSDLRIGASISLGVLFLFQSTGIVGFDLG